MSNNLTTIAALPSAGGCMSSLPPEKTDPPEIVGYWAKRSDDGSYAMGVNLADGTRVQVGIARKAEPPEWAQPKVQMRSAYFEEALELPEIDDSLIGAASVIGDAGPELHIPKTGGKITPTVNVVMNFTVGDAATVSQVRAAVAGSEARRVGKAAITKETMEHLGRNLERRREREAHRYSERFQNDERN